MAKKPQQLDGNILLAGLEPADMAALQPAMELVELRLRDRLSHADKRIQHAYFPVSGMISLVQSFNNGATSEVGLVGREGFWGTPLILGAQSAPMEAMVQGAGQALRITAGALIAAVNANAGLRSRLLRYAQWLHVQVSMTAACNGQHKVPPRLSRWLLEAQDRLGGDEIVLSHEFLSFMLGIRRAGVTAALSSLRRQGAIATTRSRIHILDRKIIETTVCECYSIVKAEYRRQVR